MTSGNWNNFQDYAQQNLNQIEEAIRQQNEARRQYNQQLVQQGYVTGYQEIRSLRNTITYLQNKLVSAEQNIRYLTKKTVDLKNSIKRSKEGKIMKSDYFDARGFCQEHRRKDCVNCQTDWMEKNSKLSNQSLAIVASSLAGEKENSLEAEDVQVRAKKDLSRKKRFIQKSLGRTEEQIKKTKVKDLPKLMMQAQEEITVGGMEELLDEDTKESGGFIKGLLRFFLKMGK